MKRSVAIAIVFVASCGPSTQTTVVETSMAPADTYTCVMRELAKMSYQVKSADRDAGFIQAERKVSGTGMAMLTGTSYFVEIAASVIPGTAGKPTQLSVSPTRTKQEGGGSRTSTGMVLKKGDKEEANAIVRACSAVSG